jgi:hypothetical protein
VTLTYTVRPISDRTAFAGKPAGGARRPFSSSWSSTRDLLDRELRHLNARNVVLELDVRENQIRLDGQLRADASATSTAVRIAFESTHGPLVYATDRYGYDGWDRPRANGWQDNVRAIALGMEALRKVDRYGITKRGEQYRGFKAIGDGRQPGLDLQAARALIDGYGGAAAALKATHPDTGGDPAAFLRVQEARKLLGGGQ